MSVDTKLVKTPYKKEKFTPDEIKEIVRCSQDPHYFIEHYVWIQHPVKGRMKFDLFDFQRELLDAYHNHRYSIALISRQMGKSTAAAAYLLWYAMYNPDQTILIAAHKYSGAQEIMQRIRFAYEHMPDFVRAGVTAYNKGSLEFDNGSRIIAQATTENTGRGLSISLAYLDEFAFVRPTIAREFWTSLSPTLSTGGKCIITSTPNQDDDQFAKIWREACKTQDEFGNEKATGKNGFKAYSADWKAHPDRDQAWADEEQGKIGEERFRREHLNEFIAFDETLVDSIKLSLLEGKDPYRKTGQVRWYKNIEKGKIYVAGLDPSLGTGGDNAAIQVYEVPSMKQVAEWMHNKTPIQEQIRILRSILTEIRNETGNDDEIYWSVENNTLGEAALVAINEMGEENIPGSFVTQTKKSGGSGVHRKGFTTTNKSKIAACSKFKNWVETDKFEIASKALLRETKTFIARGNTYAAKDGEKDDLVMAVILVVRIIQQIALYDESTYNELKDSFSDEEDLQPMPFVFLT
jgi:hypothetical protein